MQNFRKLKEIYSLLPEEISKRGVRILAWVIVRTLLDFIGIAGVLSVLYFLIKKEYMAYAVWIILLCALVLISKMFATHYIDRYCMRWYFSIYRYLSSTVLYNYFRSGLLFIREKGVNNLTYNTNGCCLALATSVIPSVISTFGQIGLVAAFMILFFVYSPFVALLFTLCTVAFSAVYYIYFRKRNTPLGEKMTAAKKELWMIAQSCFDGYPDIEIYRCFSSFQSRFRKEMNTLCECQYAMKVRFELPAYLSELMMLALLVLVFFISSSTQELIMLLGTVSVGAFKILPSVRQIVSNWISFENNSYDIDAMLEALQIRCEKPSNGIVQDLAHEIRFDDVTFSYDNQHVILSDLDLSIRKGERVGIQGVSGLGKTTMLNILMGFIVPDKGNVLIDGTALKKVDLYSWHRQIGYVPQEVFIVDASVAENIAFGMKQDEMDLSRMDEVLKAVHLYDWVHSLPEGIFTKIGEDGCRISSGQKQRIGIARALYKNAQVYIWDEATSALDEETEADIMDIVKQLTGERTGRTLILVSHNSTVVGMCDRVIHL